jgi:signal transduction histidine kinase/ligand-binding sensor domain-containing protein
MVKKAILGLLFFLSICSLSGQTGSKLQFKSISFADGLSQSIITCIAQDQAGYMWIGTRDGLNRYDGHKIEILKATDDGKPTLPSNHIQCLMVDSLGNIWIGTREDGLCRYDPRTQSFAVPVFINGSGKDVSKTTVFRIVPGANHNLYAVTSDAGIFRVDINTLATEVWPVVLPESDGSQVNLHDIVVGDGFLWLGSYGSGLLKYVPGKGVVERYTGEAPDKQYNFDYVVRMIPGTWPDLWISGWDNYLHRFNLETKESKLYDTPINVYEHHSSTHDLLLQGTDSLWLATAVGGLQLFHIGDEYLEQISTIDQPGGVGYNNILSLFRSKEGILWVGTNGKGLSYHHPGTQLFEVYSKNIPGKEKLDFESVRCIYVDDQFLFAGGYYGLNRIDLKTHKKEYFLRTKPIYCIAEHPGNPNLLLVGSEGGPLYLFDKQKGIVDQYDPFVHPPSYTKVPLSFIYAIAPFNSHQILLGTTFGCATFDLDQKKVTGLYQSSGDPASIPPGEIKSILIDSKKRIWVGSTSGGLALFDPESGRFLRYTMDTPGRHMPSNSILDLFEDTKGRLWVGTEVGLIELDPEKGMIRKVSTSEGLPVNYVVGIGEDRSGKLWLSGLAGLCNFNPETGKIEVFSKMHGLPKNEFNLQSHFKGPDGKLYFGGYDGVIGFIPEKISQDLPSPDPKFVNLLVYNEPAELQEKLPYVKHVNIKPNQDFFSVEVSAFDFLFDDEAQFRYRVMEISEDWINLGNNRIISFTKLKPSTYTLEAQVSDNISDWFSTSSPLTIVVKPSIIQQPLFKGLMLLVIVLLIFQIFFIRTRFLRSQSKRLNELVELRTLELSESEKRLQEANLTKDKFFSILAHDLRSPFSSLLGLAEILHEEWPNFSDSQKREYILGIRKNLETTYGLVNNLLDWSRLQQGRITPDLKEISLRTLVDQVILEMNAPASLKQIQVDNNVDEWVRVKADEFMLSTILRNLISNAIKYSTRGNKVLIKSTIDGTRVQCCVEDFGTGIDESQQENLFNLINAQSRPGTEGEKGTGLGLMVSHEFVRLLNGEFLFESKPGKGSRFCFSLVRV